MTPEALTVLADTTDTEHAYRGKVSIYPFAQGGKFWRASLLADAIAQAADGSMHYASMRYHEDADGNPKEGFRELRGALTFVVENGRTFIERSGNRWEVIETRATRIGLLVYGALGFDCWPELDASEAELDEIRARYVAKFGDERADHYDPRGTA